MPQSEKKERLGIYGGTFAPIHIGHLRAAKAFLSSCDLDRLLIMPAGIPPHKAQPGGDTAKDRIQMLKIAISDPEFADERVRISDFELTRPGKSYTILTLEAFSAPGRDLYLLCGTDMFLTLESWHRGSELFGLAKIVCFERETDCVLHDRVISAAKHYRNTYGADILLPEITPYPVSSTEIRERIARGLPTDGLLTPAVRTYIDENNLYRNILI